MKQYSIQEEDIRHFEARLARETSPEHIDKLNTQIALLKEAMLIELETGQKFTPEK